MKPQTHNQWVKECLTLFDFDYFLSLPRAAQHNQEARSNLQKLFSHTCLQVGFPPVIKLHLSSVTTTFFSKVWIQNNYPVVLQSFQIHGSCPFVLTPKLLVVGNNLSPPAVLCFPELCTFPAVLYSVILPDLMTCSFLCYPFSVLQLCQILSSANHLLLLAVKINQTRFSNIKITEPVLLHLNDQI